jgi:organic radical activating enzyme
MLVRYKFIEHENKTESPFVGALISAVSCDKKCKGCNTRDYKKLKTIIKDSEEIIKEVIDNKNNTGIILSGLEWSLQPMEMLMLIECAVKNGLKIFISTGYSLEEFHSRIGLAVSGNLNVNSFIGKDLIHMYAMIGAMTLNHYIEDDYYIKSGSYNNTLLEKNRVHFGVKLSSSNQNIYKIEREKNDN